MAKWMIIAENEIQLMTSRFHKYRKILLGIIIAAIVAYVAFIYYVIVPFFSDPLILNALRLNPEIVVFVLNFVFLYAFVVSILVPISGTLREANVTPLEVILSAPVEPQDLFIGTFVPRAVFYAIGAFIIMLPIDVLLILTYGMNLLGFVIFNLVAIVLIVSGVWLSTLGIGLVMSRLARTSRGQDVAKALNVILAAIIFIVIFTSGLMTPNENFSFNALSWAAYLPSGFAVNIILAVVLGIRTDIPFEASLFRYLLFIFGAFYLGYKLSGRFFNLEPIEATKVTIMRESLVYDTVRKIIPGKLGEVTTLHLKDFARRVESVSKFLYGLVIAIIILYAFSSTFTQGEVSSEIFQLILGFFIPYVSMLIVMLLGTDIMIRGKDTLWIFRHIPKGVRLFVLGKYLQVFLLELPVSMVAPLIIYVITPSLNITQLVTYIVYSVLLTMTYTASVIGIFCINPAFSEKSLKFGINVLIFVAISFIFPMIASFFVLPTFLYSPDIEMLITIYAISIFVVSGLIGLILLVFGIHRLETIE